MTTDVGEAITGGRTALGIELGSTRIKAVLIGPDHAPLAVGSSDWENQFVERRWTYSLDAVWAGLQQSYAALADDVRRRHGIELTTVGALGVSAMMHGYLAFDADGALLTPHVPPSEVHGGGHGHQRDEEQARDDGTAPRPPSPCHDQCHRHPHSRG